MPPYGDGFMLALKWVETTQRGRHACRPYKRQAEAEGSLRYAQGRLFSRSGFRMTMRIEETATDGPPFLFSQIPAGLRRP